MNLPEGQNRTEHKIGYLEGRVESLEKQVLKTDKDFNDRMTKLENELKSNLKGLHESLEAKFEEIKADNSSVKNLIATHLTKEEAYMTSIKTGWAVVAALGAMVIGLLKLFKII